MKKYIVPKNVSTRFQFFDGFGWFELFLVVAGLIIGSAIGGIVFLITKSIVGVLVCTALLGALGFFLGRPDPRTGKNALDLLKDQRAFYQKPRKYFYRFGDGRE